MDPAVIAAAVGAGGTLVASPLVAHLLSRRQRAAQTRHIDAQVDQIRQDIYQGLTTDLRAELSRVNAELLTARQSLAATNAEAERLRVRVVELESRTAQLAIAERRTLDDLAVARAQLADKDATIAALTQQVTLLQDQLTPRPTGYQRLEPRLGPTP